MDQQRDTSTSNGMERLDLRSNARAANESINRVRGAWRALRGPSNLKDSSVLVQSPDLDARICKRAIRSEDRTRNISMSTSSPIHFLPFAFLITELF